MNPEPNHKAEEIRENINTTRQRMDETIDALTDRMKGRHLVDEVIGYFRTDSGQDKAAQIKTKVTETAGTAMNTVLNSVKQNPLPAVLIGAGLAWWIYNSRRSASVSFDEEFVEPPYDGDYESAYSVSGGGYGASLAGEVEYGSDIAGQEPSMPQGSVDGDQSSGIGGKVQQARDAIRDKASQAAGQIRDKAGQVGQRVREGAQNVRQRASELGSRLQERSHEVYVRGRERVVTTAHEHPIELGLGCLALGLIAGFALPAPQRVSRVVAPRADRLKQRARESARDFMERGKHVVRAAADAASKEAQSQGLTADALRAKAGAVADRAKDAATDTARQEGIVSASS